MFTQLLKNSKKEKKKRSTNLALLLLFKVSCLFVKLRLDSDDGRGDRCNSVKSPEYLNRNTNKILDFFNGFLWFFFFE